MRVKLDKLIVDGGWSFITAKSDICGWSWVSTTVKTTVGSKPLFLDVYVIVHQFSILFFIGLGIHRGLIDVVH